MWPAITERRKFIFWPDLLRNETWILSCQSMNHSVVIGSGFFLQKSTFLQKFIWFFWFFEKFIPSRQVWRLVLVFVRTGHICWLSFIHCVFLSHIFVTYLTAIVNMYNKLNFAPGISTGPMWPDLTKQGRSRTF